MRHHINLGRHLMKYRCTTPPPSRLLLLVAGMVEVTVEGTAGGMAEGTEEVAEALSALSLLAFRRLGSMVAATCSFLMLMQISEYTNIVV